MDEFFKPNLPDETIYHVGVSGGKDSTAVLLWLVHESGVPHHKIDVTFSDTGNEHDLTYAQIDLLSRTVFPIKTLMPDLPFFDLAKKHKIFPSNARRYCTEHLKIIPASRHITGLLAACKKVVSVSGVRSDESEKRKNLEEWDFSNSLLTLQWRPLIRWTIADVLTIHRKYDVPLNPLYEMGFERVGCFPCIYSKKREVRLVAQMAPEKIERIRQVEREIERDTGNITTFFSGTSTPERFRSRAYVKKDGTEVNIATIDDVIRWSMTGKRAQGSYLDDAPEPITCVSGFCE